VDSLGYLSLEGMLNAVRRDDVDGACHACFTGEYPVRWKRMPSKAGLEAPVPAPAERSGA
jgi:glutamine phosphoribosylpyrophosphate amidotransferase